MKKVLVLGAILVSLLALTSISAQVLGDQQGAAISNTTPAVVTPSLPRRLIGSWERPSTSGRMIGNAFEVDDIVVDTKGTVTGTVTSWSVGSGTSGLCVNVWKYPATGTWDGNTLRLAARKGECTRDYEFRMGPDGVFTHKNEATGGITKVKAG